jgi:hypothetical protein
LAYYHKQDHLWRVPLLIPTLVEHYHLFLRPHEADGRELVWYATPFRLRGPSHSGHASQTKINLVSDVR